MKEPSGIREVLSAFNLKVVSSSCVWGILFVHQDNEHTGQVSFASFDPLLEPDTWTPPTSSTCRCIYRWMLDHHLQLNLVKLTFWFYSPIITALTSEASPCLFSEDLLSFSVAGISVSQLWHIALFTIRKSRRFLTQLLAQAMVAYTSGGSTDVRGEATLSGLGPAEVGPGHPTTDSSTLTTCSCPH